MLALKQIDYEYKRIDLLKLFKGLDHAEFGGVNPMNQVIDEWVWLQNRLN